MPTVKSQLARRSSSTPDGATGTPHISVIICAFTERRWSDLKAAFESCQAQTCPPTQVIVVIDHNEELAKLAGAQLHGAVVMRNTGKQGLSGARNSGVAAANGEIVAFLDDDAVAEPDWLEKLVEQYRDPATIAAGGWVDPSWQMKVPDHWPHEFDWVVGCSYDGLPRENAPTRNMIGANMSFRREVLRSVGGFRNDLGRVGRTPLGCEETELCIRALQRFPESRIMHTPHARVHHTVPLERVSLKYFRRRCYAEGISKANIVRYVGHSDGLASERKHATQVLPRAAGRDLVRSVTQRNFALFGQAAMIVLGLALTLSGYIVGTLRSRHN